MNSNFFSKIFLASTLILPVSSVQAEDLTEANRSRFFVGSNYKNGKQQLCKSLRLNPGLFTGSETSTQGVWEPYTRLIAREPSAAKREKLQAQANTTRIKCAQSATRSFSNPLTDFFWWYDTDGDNSLQQDDSLFYFATASDGLTTINTDSTKTNIHSHYSGLQAKVSKAVAIEYTGQFLITDSDGGVGVTFLSDYPNSDSYYRLRRYSGNGTLHLATHPDTEGVRELNGEIDSGVTPQPGVWYKFKIKLSLVPAATRIQAKVWIASDSEPRDYQVDASDATDQRYLKGRVGVWSMGSGTKSWKALKVRVVKP